ncbi:efflux RND transporter permease subunit [Paracoccus marcusii]|nr:efflux RND transporter permease subunit [Paracoccus marcusii]
MFLGLMVRQEAFSIVMSGIGIMALAGVVVNNNIVLIDAYNEYRGAGDDPDRAARRAASERVRPVLLTAGTTVIGLVPMVLGMTIDFTGRDLFLGAPSGQFWIQLSTGIAGAGGGDCGHADPDADAAGMGRTQALPQAGATRGGTASGIRRAARWGGPPVVQSKARSVMVDTHAPSGAAWITGSDPPDSRISTVRW